MYAAFLLLVGLIGITPVLLFVDGSMVHALLVAYAAVMMALVGALIRPGEAGFLASTTRPIAICAALLAVWMMIQVIPLPVKSWAHPIWAGAATALGAPVAGSITIDPGASLVAICRYFSATAILFLAAAVTIDRMRAEQVLFWLVGATTLAALIHIMRVAFGDVVTSTSIRESTMALSALGVILAAAAALRGLERYAMRRSDTEVPFSKFAISLSLALVAFAICAFSLVIFSRVLVSLAAASGLATLAVLVVIRRLGVGPWVGDTIAAMTIAVVIVLVLAIAGKHAGSADAVLRYASHSKSSLISVTQRIIGDTSWLGAGAGTYEFLLPIYGFSQTASLAMSAPTATAQIAIELGWPALAAVLITIIGIVFMLLRGALQRGRDSFYPAASAGCTVLVTLEAFFDASLFNTSVLICAVAALGLGLSQRTSRAIQ